MRILLLHDAFTPLSPVSVTTFLTQVVRHARNASHDLRELTPHVTEGDKGHDWHQSLLRRMLDAEMVNFNPQVIHAHGLGVLGYLALESGAPYVVSVFGDELSTVQGDSALRKYAQQAIENAGCVIVDGDETHRVAETLFGEMQAVAVAGNASEGASPEVSFAWLWRVYQQVLAARPGT